MRKFICVLICIVVAAIGARCSTDIITKAFNNVFGSNASNKIDSIYCGKWVLCSIQNSGLTFNIYESDIPSDEIPYVMFNDDGTVVSFVFGDIIEGKWAESANGVVVDSKEIIIKDGQFSIEADDNVTLIFEKSTGRPAEKNNTSENVSSSFGENLSDFYGTWEPVYIIKDGYKAEITDRKAAGFDNFYIILKKDGTAFMNFGDNGRETSWQKNNSVILLNNGGVILRQIGDKLCYPNIDSGDLYFAKSSNDDGESDEDYIRPEFKLLMNKYEKFFDDYIAFMKKYSSVSADDPMTALALLQDYLNWLEKYSEVMEEFENVGDSDMTRAEAFYYAEVSLRIEEKLLKAFE